MSEPVEKRHIDEAKQAVLDRIDALEKRNDIKHEGWRQQQSAEHGALQHTQLSILATVRWIQDQWKRFTK